MRLDLRPIGYVIGILLTLGYYYVDADGHDFSEGRGFVGIFAESALITILTGSFLQSHAQTENLKV